jgi:hypothetical protein
MIIELAQSSNIEKNMKTQKNRIAPGKPYPAKSSPIVLF